MENMNQVMFRLPKTSSLIPFIPPSSEINVGNTERGISIASGLALTWISFKNEDSIFKSLLAPAAYLFFRGLTGYCPVKKVLSGNTIVDPSEMIVTVRQRVTINRPVSEVYQFWRNLENLPNVMEHISEVNFLAGRTYKWSLKLPVLNLALSWDAVIVEDVNNERITWRSVEGSGVYNAGEVRFRVINSMRSEIQVVLNYSPPVGYVGKAFAGLLNPLFSRMVRSDIKRLKSHLEKQPVSQ